MYVLVVLGKNAKERSYRVGRLRGGLLTGKANFSTQKGILALAINQLPSVIVCHTIGRSRKDHTDLAQIFLFSLNFSASNILLSQPVH